MLYTLDKLPVVNTISLIPLKLIIIKIIKFELLLTFQTIKLFLNEKMIFLPK